MMNDSGNQLCGVDDTRLQAFLDDRATATWIKNIVRFLPVKSQFILAGNVRDFYPFPAGADDVHYQPLPLRHYLRAALELSGFEWFISYNPLGEFEIVADFGPAEESARRFFADSLGLKFGAKGAYRTDINDALVQIERIITWREHYIAVFMDFASRFTVRADSLDERSNEHFTRALMLSHSARPHTTTHINQAQFNPIFWLCDNENDLPSWLAQDNPRIKSIVLPRPDNAVRSAPVEALCGALGGYESTSVELRKRVLDEFVDQTEGMSLADMIAITELCRRERLPFSQLAEAVRRYKVGVTDDPWRKIPRQKIVGGREEIAKRVKGQSPAVIKALDIIKRAIAGLSGAQGARVGGKPRGVLFLAGPSGVGKTELAKSLTELLFGDEASYIRFDMSEFSAEHADQRLLGAPPGYVGHDSGGELTNAIKQKPFSVVLFDEIEKAHPRLLDKFLQILDDGVLTSGRGERVYFSESVIIFTSNLGIYRSDEFGRRVLNVAPEDSYEKVEGSVRHEIARYFKEQLNRPEILNRIGENIVVFDFIRPDVAVQIYEKMKASVINRLHERQNISLTFAESVAAQLQELCCRDLSNGGRGIGNQLEAWLINPLGRALFDQDVQAGSAVRVVDLREVEGIPTLSLESSSGHSG